MSKTQQNNIQAKESKVSMKTSYLAQRLQKKSVQKLEPYISNMITVTSGIKGGPLGPSPRSATAMYAEKA